MKNLNPKISGLLIFLLMNTLFCLFFQLTCNSDRESNINSSLDESKICGNSKNSEYVLPYPVGKTYTCIQGYVGRTYHQGVFEWAVDFNMSIGTVVTAARAGQVIHIEESYEDGDYGFGKENLVIVMHDDSTFGRYVHLTKNGALVDINQMVAQGDTIGLSGNTGRSLRPHLHFDVTKGGPYSDCQTIPICFKNTRPHPDGLETGVAYTANPY